MEPTPSPHTLWTTVWNFIFDDVERKEAYRKAQESEEAYWLLVFRDRWYLVWDSDIEKIPKCPDVKIAIPTKSISGRTLYDDYGANIFLKAYDQIGPDGVGDMSYSG